MIGKDGSEAQVRTSMRYNFCRLRASSVDANVLAVVGASHFDVRARGTAIVVEPGGDGAGWCAVLFAPACAALV
jgi:hypothetical protein